MNNHIRIYVSPSGSDVNDGTADKPFATFERAAAEVRKLIKNGLNAPVTVYFHKGEYSADKYEFTAADSGTEQFPVKYCAYGDGEVIFTNGKILKNSSFKPICGEMKERLPSNAKDSVLVCDLKEYGMALNKYGHLYDTDEETPKEADEEHNFEEKCELFWNDERMSVAKYPNQGLLEIEDMCDDTTDEQARIHKEKNPEGFTIIIDENTNERIKNWKTPQTAHMHGYFYWDWADASTPVSYFDTALRRVYMQSVGGYGVRKGGTYYFYNVFEELDSPGEYYLDKDNLLLYVYPLSDIQQASVMLSVSRHPLIKANGISHITFEGITFKGACANGFEINGNNCSVINCKILDVYDWAMRINGNNNKIYGCDISRTGRGGISLIGGDRTTLTPSGNIVENNYVHDWSEVVLTYGAGIEFGGCGSIARHNELARTSHMAIYYDGNDHIIEYNYIHEVVQQSNDAGAIYGGRDWAGYGDIIRYNIIENAGNDKYTPAGIYWDDCQSGQTAYGNIIKNAMGKSFLIGGGKDNVVENNMMLVSEYPMQYDERGIEGVLSSKGWYGGARKDGNNWPIFRRSPVKSDIWAKRFPALARVNDNYDNPYDPDFAANPSRAVIRNNICVCSNDYGFFVAETVKKLGTIENNPVFASEDECIVKGSRYKLTPEAKKAVPEFKDIPVDKIGRYK